MDKAKKIWAGLIAVLTLGGAGFLWSNGQNDETIPELDENSSSSNIKENTSVTSSSTTSENSNVSGADNSQVSDNIQTVERKLAVDPQRCRGCGRCVRLAPDNFQMSLTTRKAQVISQENLGGAEVQEAISSCPASAISIS